MRQRVEAMRAQMAQPQAATNNTAQGASNSGTGNVLGFTGVVGAPVQPQSLASMEADDAARAARVAAMRAQMGQ